MYKHGPARPKGRAQSWYLRSCWGRSIRCEPLAARSCCEPLAARYLQRSAGGFLFAASRVPLALLFGPHFTRRLNLAVTAVARRCKQRRGLALVAFFVDDLAGLSAALAGVALRLRRVFCRALYGPPQRGHASTHTHATVFQQAI